MRVHLHDYSTPDMAGIVDGAVLAHRETADLLLSRGGVAHDLTRATDPRAVLSGLTADDVVYAGSGPFAYLYHQWRERHGGSYRIVREVHTALWSGWWAQEELCAPLLRDGDVVLFPTEFTRRLFIAHTAGVEAGNSAVAYPMTSRLPRRPPVRAPGTDDVLRIGYLGALSTAKNFDQVLNVFAKVYDGCGGRARLVFAGKPNDVRWAPDRVVTDLVAAGVKPDAVSARGVLAPDELSGFFDDIDVLLFPSTASRESLGRVVIEALAYGVPVLAADVGPAVELLPAANLVPTTLRTGHDFSMGRVEALGHIDEDVLADALLHRRYEPAGPVDGPPYDDASFLSVLAGEMPAGAPHHDERIVRQLRIEARPAGGPGPDPEAAAAIFGDYFARRHEPLLDRIAAHEAATLRPRADLREVVIRPERNLADFRAFPRLVDALLLSPLTYRIGEP